MNALASLIDIAERVPLPDAVIRLGIRALCARTAAKMSRGNPATDAALAQAMAARAVTEHTDAANARHSEVPATFFGKVLGPHRKYSSCFYRDDETDLAQAEAEALRLTIEHADLRDGQSILELGCGWGSLSLAMAEQFPHARIVSVSNSVSQREYIERETAARRLMNLRVVTSDMNVFEPHEKFDRVVSVEMFEHMMNWRKLMGWIRGWLKPDGSFFMHVFSHRRGAYLFDSADRADWIARHFFAGGVMPSHRLIQQYADLFKIDEQWRWSGRHYQRTADDWLINFDQHRGEIETILRPVYGDDTALWMQRWRWFFLATSGLFGYADGDEWGVSHYRLKPA
ncbi:class I SAM-dependent methyltransferase [Rhodopseudomonas sp. WA056]|uniref:SAM-dependent methyltransferase n=1 Tax=Rhodopseudomonas sp. WA056 TaxID=2269367 RepID=UPI0013DF6264|nr:cyclopropane-fatty-acyl-phospholipid synthase family protein [Rhodopseudomonas sp. WA056]NEW90204.1 class I SAM-dependent methyltransferase [Rhodopseudomonas sp. WA056]